MNISHFTFLKSHFILHYVHLLLHILHFTLHDLWNGKWEMRLTFHISQMPNVICETNMKRDFNFSKNDPLDLLTCKECILARQSSRGFMFPGGSTAGQVISKWRRVFTHEIGNQGEDEKRAESKSEVVAFQPADGWKIEIALKEFIQQWFVILRWWEHVAIYLHRLQVCKCGHVKCNIFYYEWTVIHVLQYFNFKSVCT